MRLSYYQQLKPIVNELLGLTNDAIHMHIGFFALIATLIIVKKRMNPWLYLVPGFVLSILMEILDIRDDYVYGSRMHFVRNLHDIINTNLIPVVVVWFFYVSSLRKKAD